MLHSISCGAILWWFLPLTGQGLPVKSVGSKLRDIEACKTIGQIGSLTTGITRCFIPALQGSRVQGDTARRPGSGAGQSLEPSTTKPHKPHIYIRNLAAATMFDPLSDMQQPLALLAVPSSLLATCQLSSAAHLPKLTTHAARSHSQTTQP